jgi:hypothetical protein
MRGYEEAPQHIKHCEYCNRIREFYENPADCWGKHLAAKFRDYEQGF